MTDTRFDIEPYQKASGITGSMLYEQMLAGASREQVTWKAFIADDGDEDRVHCLNCDRLSERVDQGIGDLTGCAGHSACSLCGADFTFGGYEYLDGDDGVGD